MSVFRACDYKITRKADWENVADLKKDFHICFVPFFVAGCVLCNLRIL